MKKFKKSIEVKGENVQALFECPIVTTIDKAVEAIEDGLDVNDPLLGVKVVVNLAHRVVKRGSFIVQDVCGHWEVMDVEQWELHKDDTIEEDEEVPDSGTGDKEPTEETPIAPDGDDEEA